jgi:hypothetical protein
MGVVDRIDGAALVPRCRVIVRLRALDGHAVHHLGADVKDKVICARLCIFPIGNHYGICRVACKTLNGFTARGQHHPGVRVRVAERAVHAAAVAPGRAGSAPARATTRGRGQIRIDSQAKDRAKLSKTMTIGHL